MVTSPKLDRRAAAAAICIERFGLSAIFLWLAALHLHRILIFSGPEKSEIEGSPFLGIAREVVQLQLYAFVGFLLLLGRRVAMPPRSVKDIAVPLITTFFYLTYDTVPWMPEVLRRSLCPPGWQTAFASAGLFLNFIGLAIALWGTAALGRSFGFFIAVRTVICTGAYRWVRHPIYLGYLGLTAGLAISQFSIACLALASVHVCLMVYRARLEEARLSDYSAEYREYQKRTGFIFPKLRRPALD